MNPVNNIDISKLSQKETKDLVVALLGKIAAAYDTHEGMGRELFEAIARVKVTLTPEVVCLRQNPKTKKVEAYLTRRSLDDTAYPGQWHVPGSAIRPGEEIEDVFA